MVIVLDVAVPPDFSLTACTLYVIVSDDASCGIVTVRRMTAVLPTPISPKVRWLVEQTLSRRQSWLGQLEVSVKRTVILSVALPVLETLKSISQLAPRAQLTSV